MDDLGNLKAEIVLIDEERIQLNEQVFEIYKKRARLRESRVIIVKRIGAEERRLKQVLAKGRRSRSALQAKVVDMFVSGMKKSEIALEIGRTPAMVDYYLWRDYVHENNRNFELPTHLLERYKMLK